MNMRRERSTLFQSASLVIAVGMVTAAGAQELEPFEQRGLRTGTFNLFPSLSVATGYNDNVLAAPEDSAFADVSEDVLTVVSPRLRLETNTQRHFFFFDVGADSARYLDLTDQNFDDFDVEAGATWDISRTLSLSGALSYEDAHESAEDPDRRAEALVGITEIDRYRGNLRLDKRWRRGFVRLNTAFRRSEFDDVGSDVFADLGSLNALTPTGSVNVNDGRDVSTFPTNLRLGYNADPNYDVFVDFGYTATRYDRNDLDLTRFGDAGQALAPSCSLLLSSGGPSELAPGVGGNPLARTIDRDDCFRITASEREGRNRDFDVYRMLFGADVDLARQVTGEFSAGLEYRTFEDPDGDEGLGFSFSGDVDWALTPRTVVNVNGEHGFRPTVDGATLGTVLGTNLTFALSQKALVGGSFIYDRDDRTEGDRVDDTFDAGLFASYSFNRYVSLGANYGYRQRISTSAAREFTQNTFFLSLRGQY